MSGSAGSGVPAGGAVTARWADALFNVAERAGALDEVRHDAERLSSEMARPGVAAFFFGGGVSEAERRSKLDTLVDTLHPVTAKFVRLLFDRRRQEVLQSIGPAFKRRVLEASGEVEGTLESARPLAQAEIDAVAGKVSALVGKRVRLASAVNPELIAGVRVLVGASMLDASVQGRLAGLRQRLLEAPLPTPGN